MKRAAWAVVPLLLSACGPSGLPTPSIVSVSPGRVAEGQPSSLAVRVNAVLPFTVDYQNQQVDPAELKMTLRLAGQQVEVPFVEPDGTLVAPVPEGLVEGSYDVELALEDGREAVRQQAFSVVPEPVLHGPNSPHTPDEAVGGVRGFQIDPIPEQVRNTPFQITVRADGPEAPSFQAGVSVRASKGTVMAIPVGSFVGGVLVEQISLSMPGPDVYLLVEDTQGHRGLSNSFRVRPN
jgi:hypothetical protein